MKNSRCISAQTIPRCSVPDVVSGSVGDVSSNMSVAIKCGSRSNTRDTCIGQMDVMLGTLLDRCTNSTNSTCKYDEYYVLQVAHKCLITSRRTQHKNTSKQRG